MWEGKPVDFDLPITARKILTGNSKMAIIHVQQGDGFHGRYCERCNHAVQPGDSCLPLMAGKIQVVCRKCLLDMLDLAEPSSIDVNRAVLGLAGVLDDTS